MAFTEIRGILFFGIERVSVGREIFPLPVLRDRPSKPDET
jgi:hypothetical protein